MKKLRRQLKSGLAKVLYKTSFDNLVGRARGVSDSPLIICYHRVVQHFDDASTWAMPSLLVSTEMFEKQLDWLAEHFDMVSLEEILSGAPDTGKKHRRRATITFDDGYADFYWNALPILLEKKIPSAIFVVTDLVGTPRLQTHDELYLLLSHWFLQKAPQQRISNHPLAAQLEAALALHTDPYQAARYILAVFSQQEVFAMMELLKSRVEVSTQSLEEFQSVSWPMLRTMTSHGVTVGSHTRSHVLLPHHEQQRVIAELSDSREALEAELGVPAKFLAYPDGQFNNRIAGAAEAVGYDAALTICNHVSPQHPRYSVPRVVLWENAAIDETGEFSPAIMSCLVNGVFGLSSRCAQDHTPS